MNTDRGAFVALPTSPSRVGIITFGNGLTRTVMWLDDYSFQDIRFNYLIEAKRPPKQQSKYDIPTSSGKIATARFAATTTELCSDCQAKSADCAYGQLRGSQSCMDTRERFQKK